LRHAGGGRERFESMYAALPPWDIGRPQGAVVDAAARGLLDGGVLDIGCGTGDNSIFLAGAGHRVVGVDCVPSVIERAIANASSQGVSGLEFVVADVLESGSGLSGFDHALDTGLFHHLTRQQRVCLADVLASAVRASGTYVTLGFDESAYSDAGSKAALAGIREAVSGPDDPSPQRPPSVSAAQIVEAFSGPAWRGVRVEPARFETRLGDVPALLAIVERQATAWPPADC
jgi:SAM-dependent methyltransferase